MLWKSQSLFYILDHGFQILRDTMGFVWKFAAKSSLSKNMVVYGLLFAGAEFSQQLITRKFKVYGFLTAQEASQLNLNYFQSPPTPFNYKLMFSYWVVGTFIISVALHYWYIWLDFVFPGSQVFPMATKLILDLGFMGPVMIILFFLGNVFIPFLPFFNS